MKMIKTIRIRCSDFKVGDIVETQDKRAYFVILYIKKHCDCHNCDRVKKIKVMYLDDFRISRLYNDSNVLLTNNEKRNVLRFYT